MADLEQIIKQKRASVQAIIAAQQAQGQPIQQRMVPDTRWDNWSNNFSNWNNWNNHPS